MFLGMSNFADFELEAEFDWHKPGVRKRNVTDFRWQITWSVNHQFQISTIDLVADIDIFNSDNLVTGWRWHRMRNRVSWCSLPWIQYIIIVDADGNYVDADDNCTDANDYNADSDDEHADADTFDADRHLSISISVPVWRPIAISFSAESGCLKK